MNDAKLKYAKQLMAAVAKQNGVTEEQVREEIEKAIDAMLETPADDLTRFRQKQIPHCGKRVTPEELIIYLAEQAAK